jgi:hypothetical protein
MQVGQMNDAALHASFGTRTLSAFSRTRNR